MSKLFKENFICEINDVVNVENESDSFPLLTDVRNEARQKCDSFYLDKLLTVTSGNISAAARLAGIHRKSLGELLKKYNMNSSTYKV